MKKTLLHFSFAPLFLIFPGCSALAFSYNTTDTITFSLLSEARFNPDLPQMALPDQKNRPYVYVAAQFGGLIVFRETGAGALTEAARIQPELLRDLAVTNVSQQGDFLYLALGNFWGDALQSPGVAIVEVSQPDAPRVKDLWFDELERNGAAFVKAVGNYAYLAAMDSGLYVFDVSSPTQIKPLSYIWPNPNFPSADPNSVREAKARGLDVVGDDVYLSYGSGGIRRISVADKERPVETSRYINRQILERPQRYNSIVVDGGLAYVGVDYCGLEILDISNPRGIDRLAWWNPWACGEPAHTPSNSAGHINQVALDADLRLVYLSAGESELQVVDVSNPVNPLLKGSYGQPGNGMGAWSVGLREKRIYLTYIAVPGEPFRGTWSGIKVLQADVVNANRSPAWQYMGLDTPHPNPFSVSLTTDFTLSSGQEINVSVYNSLGQPIAQPLHNAFFPAGTHHFEWRPEVDLAPGLYWLAWEAAGRIQVQKVMKVAE